MQQKNTAINKTANLTAFAFCIAISGCASQQMVPYSVIEQSSQCRISQAEIRPLSSSHDRDKISQQLKAFNLQKNDALEQRLEQHGKQENLYLISQGQKPSAGYGFTIESNLASLEETTLHLPITFNSPKKGGMQAAVMTSPCLIIGIDNSVYIDKIIADTLVYNLE